MGKEYFRECNDDAICLIMCISSGRRGAGQGNYMNKQQLIVNSRCFWF